MKNKFIILILIFALAASFASCGKTPAQADKAQGSAENVSATGAPASGSAITPEIPPEIAEDMKADAGGFTERELELIDNLNDVDMRDFTLPDFDGYEHSLSDYKGQIIILNFWAVGCPPCINEMPDFDKVAQKDGVVLVTVVQKNILGNEKEKSYEFIKQFDTVALWDENHDTVNVYPSQYYPHTYIIDRSGIVRFVMNSAGYELLDELVSFCDEKFN